ncbi:Disease resistance protein RPM1 [Acorus calamus]|uniref:Disease resistance protein RPM1 n=1 Tax=Acorus calamus TaxID=4465 RepID=A0AAV9CWB8_ACOCL|nr:Disease resistance protein RPM1 [Acorus calamus]
MAEAIVGALALKITYVLAANLLKTIILEERKRLKDMEDNLRFISEELDVIRELVKKADQSENDTVLEAWVNQVRNLAYKIEGTIDEFTYFMGGGKKKTFAEKALHLAGNIGPLLTIAENLEKLRKDVTDVGDRAKRLNISGPGEGSSSDIGSSNFGPPEVPYGVGTEGDEQPKGYEKLLIEWLEEDEQHMKIIVCGMGGIGKTTLVSQVYRRSRIGHFHCRAWITLPHKIETRDVLKYIIGQFFPDMQENVGADASRLGRILAQKLQERRYLIVFDDVWNAEIWNNIHTALPRSNRSRIIFTTRDHKLASKLQQSPSSSSLINRVLQLEPLKYDQAWDLFRRCAFRGGLEGRCPEELHDTASAIVRRCDGLPHAIVLLGDHMRAVNHSVPTWNDSATISLIDGNEELKKMSKKLMRSFHDLPYYLKNCFLYCSAFPKDYRIKRKRIIRLWIAEGFVEKPEGSMMTLEKKAEDYLKELTQKSMLLVVRANHWERPKEYRMHDVARELAMWISKKQKFCTEHGDCDAYRLSVTKDNNSFRNGTDEMPDLRSLLVFAIDESVSSTLVNVGYKLLGVLDLQGASIESIPISVVNLFNLKYLSLRGTKVRVLPKSLRKLRNLQTLDLRYSNIKELPGGLKLQSLRHLFIIRSVEENGQYEGMQMPSKMWASKDVQMYVQTLQGITANDEVVQEVGNLTQLKSFMILGVRESHGVNLCNSIKKMAFLHHLHVQAADKGEGSLILNSLYPSRGEIQSGQSPPLIVKLSLKGRLETFPEWFGSLENLKDLYLGSSGLTVDPLPSLQSLPSLLHLSLFKAYQNKILRFNADGFRSLKQIWLGELSQLNQIVIEEGAMPSLQKLSLVRCKEFRMLPHDFGRLTTLKQLYLQEMPGVLLESIRERGDDHQKIKGLNTVVHFVQVDGEWTFESFKK